MTETTREQISALLDDELSGHEVQSAVEKMSESEELRGLWGRYQLMSDAIRGEPCGKAGFSIVDQVHEQLKSEPAILAMPKPPAGKQAPKWVRPLVGTALAASVAVLAVLSVPRFLGLGTGGALQVADTGSEGTPTQMTLPQTASTLPVAASRADISPQLVSAPAAAVSPGATNPPLTVKWYTSPSGSRWKNLQHSAVESKLNGYLINHSEYADHGGMQGVVPYATFISYDANK